MRISIITLLYTSVRAQDGTPNGYCWRQFQKELEICGEAWTQLPECHDGSGFDYFYMKRLRENQRFLS